MMRDELYRPRSRRKIPERIKYYVSQDGENYGPLTLGQMQGYFRAGSFTDAAFYWHEGMDEWQKLEELEEMLTVKAVATEDAYERRRQNRLETRKRDRKARTRQILIMLVALIVMTVGVAGIIFFAGRIF